ncbi:MAG TPA: GFA family protein [Allosphingosinicella sp.]|nr:GFA family protein [Allosphingosinicella sp.]
MRYRIEGEPRRVGLCHCTDCRGHSGAPVVAWAIFGKEQLEARGDLNTYASSEHGRRQFCARCGTGLFYLNDETFEGLVDVQIATLDDPDALRPVEQVQVAERIGWMKTAHALPAHQRFPD